MIKLTNEELININGGAIKGSVAYILGTIAIFVTGLISGFTRPYSCNSGK